MHGAGACINTISDSSKQVISQETFNEPLKVENLHLCMLWCVLRVCVCVCVCVYTCVCCARAYLCVMRT